LTVKGQNSAKIFSMLNKFNQKYQKFVLVTLFILFLLASLYWFEIRPANIRKSCLLEIQNKTGGPFKRLLDKEGYFPNEEENNDYRVCLVKNGIKAENLSIK